MHLWTLLSLLTLAIADDIIRPGTMFITQIDNQPTHQLLRFENDKVVTGDDRFYFRFGVEGTLESYKPEKYLGITDRGYLTGRDTPQSGFTVTTIEGTKWNRSLAYKGDVNFQLCGDNSVAYKSNCEGARPITITYRDAIQPRVVLPVQE